MLEYQAQSMYMEMPKMSGNAKVSDRARIFGAVYITGKTKITGGASEIRRLGCTGNAWVSGKLIGNALNKNPIDI
jgi:hypothetical protein